MHVVDTECIANSLFREELVSPSVMNFGVNDHHLAVKMSQLVCLEAGCVYVCVCSNSRDGGVGI